MDFGEKSLLLHGQEQGKLAITAKVPLASREDLAVAYTPGVGRVSSEVAAKPDLAWTHTIKGNMVAVVSDGSAVLGLGNLGPLGALPVMEGKALLFKELAGVNAFPICLDTQDTEEIIETVKRIAPVFGGINLEDIAAPKCFEIEERLKQELPIAVFHDDQHGTAIVVLAALINALKLRGSDKAYVRVVINGAGAAGIAIAKILLAYGFENIVLCDSQGIVSEERGDLNEMKKSLLAVTNPNKLAGDLSVAVADANVFIGVSKAGLLTSEMVQSMNQRPIIFAMANPVPEIMPDEALAAGAFIVATGRSDFPNQINNVLAFPGVFRGVLDHRLTQITPAMMVRAAEALAHYVEDPKPEALLPDPLDKGVVAVVARAIA